MNKIILLIISYLLALYVAFAQTPTYTPIDPHWQLEWEDHFNSLDQTRWIIKDRESEHNEHTFFLEENVYTSNGNLVIKVNNNRIVNDGQWYIIPWEK